MFCKTPLGSNVVVEAFPVGRRLAFDPAKGRLWVVCRSCERWNLTSLEERDDARRAINALLPLVNGAGATARHIREAVSRIESHGDPHRFLADSTEGGSATTARELPAPGRGKKIRLTGPGWVRKMPKPTRLALEMALHEEQERRALEDELAQFERAWREAEEIAVIADNLLLPEHTDEFLDRHSPRGRSGEPS